MGRKRAGSRGRSHHRGPRKTASASTSDDDGPLITRWWWPRPHAHHRQKQPTAELQDSSKPVGVPEGAALALAITVASDVRSEAMHDMLVQVSGNSGQCADDAMLLQRTAHADVLEWL
ncbi:hypothetical protein WJX82_007063 [Trebouxia sp. C0006]